MFNSKGKINVIKSFPKPSRRTCIKNVFKDSWFGFWTVDWIRRYFGFPHPSFFAICCPKERHNFFHVLAFAQHLSFSICTVQKCITREQLRIVTPSRKTKSLCDSNMKRGKRVIVSFSIETHRQIKSRAIGKQLLFAIKNNQNKILWNKALSFVCITKAGYHVQGY